MTDELQSPNEIIVRRTWADRLFSWPWRPWVSHWRRPNRAFVPQAVVDAYRHAPSLDALGRRE